MTYCVAPMQLCPVWCGSLDGRGFWRRMDICMCMAEFLCCPSETITVLLIDSTPIQNKHFKKKRTGCGEGGEEQAFSPEKTKSRGGKEWSHREWGELPAIFVLFFSSQILLKYSWFTMLCWFLLCSKFTVTCIYLYFFVFLSTVVYHRILNIAPCTIQ